MKSNNNFKSIFADFFDLPKDVVLNLPRIIVIGNKQFYVENHHGIIEYADEVVRIRITAGELKVAGNKLIVRSIYQEEVLVEGEIEKIEFGE